MSAYQATVDRENTLLASVCSMAERYRGGNNNAAWDGTYRSLLGMPATQISLTDFRAYARKRGTAGLNGCGWNCYTYDAHVTLWWLFVTEYATLNSQAGYNEKLTAEGYRQGGLGDGITTITGNEWKTYNSNCPISKCGYTDNVGNKTTRAVLHIENDDASISLNVSVIRYRGVENLFGHIWKNPDGLIVIASPTEANGGDDTSKVYIASDPRLFNDTDVSGYRFAGLEVRADGYIKTISFGEFGDVVPTEIGGSSLAYYCDYHYNTITNKTIRRLFVLGGASDGNQLAGIMSMMYHYFSDSANGIGSRLCFIPQK